ncbi:MAG TPA: cytochrome c biogenesis protein CcsA [Candidatus Hydrogenedens sp.]|nr:cytochrome c biogenesis protein CcsA [Candidatus Hydrogenedens sp.]HOL20190.1 cytochrome c biogenesis protein CcsA [Candidatus Hydrogenedens sp.]HPP59825.1 cytochrome c biogenesis protein CcsA [Candidatus Hydrogenedens sp.]
MTFLLISSVILSGFGFLTTEELSPEAHQTAELIAPQWDKEIIALAEKLPIQSDGRIKPLSTHARFLLLRLSGKTSIKNQAGRNLSPTEWFIDCLFYPDIARQYPVFIVHDLSVLENLGLKGHEKKRDRYAYNELIPAREELMSQAQRYSQIHPSQRTRIQEQVLNLADNVLIFEEIIGYLDFARYKYSLSSDSLLSQFFPEKKEVFLSEIIEIFPEIKKKLKELSQTMNEEQTKEALSTIRNLLGEVSQLVHSAEHFTVIPPANPSEKEWLSPLDTVIQIFDPSVEDIPDIHLFLLFTKLELKKGNSEEFGKLLAQLVHDITTMAEIRGEGKKINLEVLYYKGKFLFYSQWIFFLALVLTAIWWLSVENRVLKFSVFSVNTLALLLLIIAITFRCIIRGRPPVTTLYETILFSTATAVLLAFIIEWFTKDNISLSLASFLGLLGLFLANRYEMKEGTDTMPSLVAVLDTNFWLTIHVTTIVIGYGAGLLASAFGHVWILGKLLGLKKTDTNFYKRLSRGIYGTICFCFFFSFVGTVLGGIWALQSWGRFWGWDPKENGALLIVLWCLIVIHAHLGKLIKSLGEALGSIILGVVVSFSWWGVNLLGVGLHSYGFTRGAWNSLLIFWLIEVLFVLSGVYISVSEKKQNLTLMSNND